MAEGEEELKSLLMRVKKKREYKSWLKTQHSKNKIVASGSIISWPTDGENVETVSYFIFVGKITKSLWMVTAAMKLEDSCSLEGKL